MSVVKWYIYRDEITYVLESQIILPHKNKSEYICIFYIYYYTSTEDLLRAICLYLGDTCLFILQELIFDEINHCLLDILEFGILFAEAFKDDPICGPATKAYLKYIHKKL